MRYKRCRTASLSLMKSRVCGEKCRVRSLRRARIDLISTNVVE